MKAQERHHLKTNEFVTTVAGATAVICVGDTTTTSVAASVPNLTDEQRRAAYNADITYGTNNEFGFDYLRDNMKYDRASMVQRPFAMAIVDEVDSVLIDEARTPLIISGRIADAAKLYYRFASIVRSLHRDVDYEVEEDKRVVVPLEAGIEKVEQALGIENLYDEVQQNLVHQLAVALKAKELYRRDKDYIIQNGEVKIVDEFTGRVLEGRRWSEGIHQAVEAKEGVKIKEENQTLATITLQNYFRMYDKLAGMTGTAQTEAAELGNTYELQVVPIPTNRPAVRLDQADLIYKTEEAKFRAVVDDIAERYERGQPVLVGTTSIEASEHLAALLGKEKLPHQVLNAKQHEREAGIIAEHNHTREAAGLFDVSHMGEARVRGRDAAAFLDRIMTNDMASLRPGMARYTVMCQPDGGCVDDLIVYRFSETEFLICLNASNAAKDLAIRLAVAREDGNLQRAAKRLGVTDRALQIRRAAGA